MSRKTPRRAARGALELIEEAVHLLRLSPLSVLGSYYLGSLPFVLGFLYFWADMSRSSTAREHCASFALAVALLFLWMKTWQAVFARRLKAQITDRPAPALTVSRWARVAVIQIILQPSGLFLLALSLAILLPFGWVYAFYQSITAFGAEEGAETRHVFKKSFKHAQLWPGQNHLLLGLLLLFALVVFLDLVVGLVTIPSLIKMLFGVETVFARSPWSFLNTTFVAIVCSLTYLCLDPLLKAAYLLRCFYGESLQTGEDLQADLRTYAPTVRSVATGMFVVLVAFNGLAGPDKDAPERGAPAPPRPARQGHFDRAGLEPRAPIRQFLVPRHAPKRMEPLHEPGSAGILAGVLSGGVSPARMPALPESARGRMVPVRTTSPENSFSGLIHAQTARMRVDTIPASSEPQPTAIPTPHSGISPPDLDRALEEVIQRPEFTWRLPREMRAGNQSKQGMFASFVEGALKTIRDWGRAVARWLKTALHWIVNVVDWLREKILGKRATAREEASAGADGMVLFQALIFVLLVLAACAVAILFYRTWRRRGTRQETASEVIVPLPDLSGENISASQLPEDGWLNLAGDLMSQGELRLALRAFYLASLAHLAQRELISVAKFKSNREYERELRRRAGGRADLQAAFAENVGIFDHVWYGLHEVTQEAIGRFQFNLEKIRTC